MGTPNTNDGTMLGTAEVISDEYVDPNAVAVRREPNLPPTAYKLPRSKIAVGPYGTDGGDASSAAPLYVESLQERQIAELEAVRSRGRGHALLSRYSEEQLSLVDARGHDMATRGVR